MSKRPIFDKVWTVPNVMSMFRLLLIPLIIYFYIFRQNYVATVIIITVSGVTDVVDGFIARKYDMVTEFGKTIDPVADKLTQIAILVCLVTNFWWLAIPLGLMLIKELFAVITGLAVVSATGSVHGANWHGKLTTVVLYVVMGLHVLWNGLPFLPEGWQTIPNPLSYALTAVTTAVMLLSFVLYSVRNNRLVRDAARERSAQEQENGSDAEDKK